MFDDSTPHVGRSVRDLYHLGVIAVTWRVSSWGFDIVLLVALYEKETVLMETFEVLAQV
jgi:hypothetical protein